MAGNNFHREELSSLCYATSMDGIHWHKPALGIVDFDGSSDNNLLLPWGNLVQGDVTSATILPPFNAQSPQDYQMVDAGAGLHRRASSGRLGRWFTLDAQHGSAAGDERTSAGGRCVVNRLPEPEADRIAAYYRIPLRGAPRPPSGGWKVMICANGPAIA